MFKKLFLSIIILSALASEGGAYFSADLLDYYLVNFTRLDIMQDSQIINQAAKAEGFAKTKGTPAAFYKIISQNAVDLKNSIRHNYPDFTALVPLAVGLALIAVFYNTFIINLSSKSGSFLLSLTDSSPPVLAGSI